MYKQQQQQQQQQWFAVKSAFVLSCVQCNAFQLNPFRRGCILIAPFDVGMKVPKEERRPFK